MWFKKKKNDKNTYVETGSFDDLKADVERLQKRNNKLTDDLLKLKRIIKYSKDKPTFRLCNTWDRIYCVPRIKYDLYLYIDKEEYVIRLDELTGKDIDMDSAELVVNDDIAYFNISSYITCAEKKNWTKHKFIIEFKNDKYVYSQEDDEERNNKESAV